MHATRRNGKPDSGEGSMELRIQHLASRNRQELFHAARMPDDVWLWY
jgi:hypothetical protein